SSFQCSAGTTEDSGRLRQILREQRVEDRVDPLAFPEIGAPLPPLPHVADPVGVGAGALVEGVDLELEPVEAELVEQEALELPRRVVRDPPAAEARVDGEALDPRDPVPLVRDVKAERARRLAVDLDHEAAERLRLGERPLDLLDDLPAV